MRDRTLMPRLATLTRAIVKGNEQPSKPHQKWVGGYRPGRDCRRIAARKRVPITLAPVKLPEIPE